MCLCGVCGARLPDELLFTPQERAAVERDMEELKRRDKEMRKAESENRPGDSGYFDFGGIAGF